MKSIAVIYGGRSTEHDVSVMTALLSIIKPLELTKKYKVIPIYVAKNGNWYSDKALSDVALFSSGKIDNWVKKNTPITLQFQNGLVIENTKGLLTASRKIKIDIVFPSMHGTYGEDGSLMGLLRMANVPFVGCDMDASVIAMDKVLSKQIAEAAGIPVSKYTNIMAKDFAAQQNAVLKEVTTALKYPLFVKPAHLGSSIGISRAKNDSELVNALEVACHYDDKVIVEEEVQNLTEVTLPIMGNETLQLALLERPLTSAEDFFDFDTKYMNGGKKGGAKGGKLGAQGYSELPAKLDKKLYKKAEEIGQKVYTAIGCSGIARVDMLIDNKTQEVYFNEINPLPGDLYRHNWRAAGISSTALVDKLVVLAEERWELSQHKNTVFSTNFLKQF